LSRFFLEGRDVRKKPAWLQDFWACRGGSEKAFGPLLRPPPTHNIGLGFDTADGSLVEDT